MSTIETPLIVAEKRALEEELHTLKMSIYDRREVDTEIESFKQTIKQLEEKLEQMRNECQDLYKQKHEDAEEQIARKTRIDDLLLIYQRFLLVRNELNGQLESYETKLATTGKLVEELKRENAKIVKLNF